MVDGSTVITVATANDVGVLAELGARTFVDAYPSYDPDDMSKHIATTFSDEVIATELGSPGNRFLIAWAEQEAVGYAFMQPGTDVRELSGTNPIELNRIYMDKKCMGRGVGSELIQRCIDYATGAGFDTLWLGVWTENAAAIRFYERWGFESVGTHPFRFGDRMYSDLVMARRLA